MQLFLEISDINKKARQELCRFTAQEFKKSRIQDFILTDDGFLKKKKTPNPVSVLSYEICDASGALQHWEQ